MAESVKTEPREKAPPESGPAESAPRRRLMRQRRATRADFLSTVLALLAALVSVFLAHGLFKLENDLVLLLIAYATFVGTLVATQIAEQRTQLETDARRAAAAAAAPPISAFVPSDDDDIVVDLTIDDTAPIDLSELELERSRRQAGEIDLRTDPESDKPRRLRVITRDDIGNVFFALLGAVAFAGVVRTIWGLHGPTGTFLVGYLAFLVIFFVLVRDRARRRSRDSTASSPSSSGPIGVLVVVDPRRGCSSSSSSRVSRR